MRAAKRKTLSLLAGGLLLLLVRDEADRPLGRIGGVMSSRSALNTFCSWMRVLRLKVACDNSSRSVFSSSSVRRLARSVLSDCPPSLPDDATAVFWRQFWRSRHQFDTRRASPAGPFWLATFLVVADSQGDRSAASSGHFMRGDKPIRVDRKRQNLVY